MLINTLSLQASLDDVIDIVRQPMSEIKRRTVGS